MSKLKKVLIGNIVIFSIVGMFHLIRAVSGWSLESGPYTFPAWYSYLAVVLLASFIYGNWSVLK